jgi:hypothetical protein
MLEGNIPTLEAPHKQPSTISNYEKWEKKRTQLASSRSCFCHLTHPGPQVESIEPRVSIQGDGFRLQARATSSVGVWHREQRF